MRFFHQYTVFLSHNFAFEHLFRFFVYVNFSEKKETYQSKAHSYLKS